MFVLPAPENRRQPFADAAAAESMEGECAGIIRAGLPQLPVTTLNSVVAVCQLSADAFPGRAASPVAVATSVGLMNLAGAWFGAMPCCHGAGGLAAQARPPCVQCVAGKSCLCSCIKRRCMQEHCHALGLLGAGALWGAQRRCPHVPGRCEAHPGPGVRRLAVPAAESVPQPAARRPHDLLRRVSARTRNSPWVRPVSFGRSGCLQPTRGGSVPRTGHAQLCDICRSNSCFIFASIFNSCHRRRGSPC